MYTPHCIHIHVYKLYAYRCTRFNGNLFTCRISSSLVLWLVSSDCFQKKMKKKMKNMANILFCTSSNNIVTFSHVLHLDIIRRQDRKVKTEISSCMAIMLDHTHGNPYIHSTTVLCDVIASFPGLPHSVCIMCTIFLHGWNHCKEGKPGDKHHVG